MALSLFSIGQFHKKEDFARNQPSRLPGNHASNRQAKKTAFSGPLP